jgi:hypothetical protein
MSADNTIFIMGFGFGFMSAFTLIAIVGWVRAVRWQKERREKLR